MSKHLLTFEVDKVGEKLEIHANVAGLEFLIGALQRLRDAARWDHTHRMTDGWGGCGLSSNKQSDGGELVKHVKVFRW